MDPAQIVSERAKLFLRTDVQPVEDFRDASIRDAGHLDVLFRENAAKGGIVRLIARTIRDEEHIRYP
jgi:hypothetical protein